MSQTKSFLEQHEELLEKVKDFNLMNHVFMAVALQDKYACQHVVRILTGNSSLKVVSVKTEYRISKLVSHDAILDILAEDENGELYNLEIQRLDTVDHARRTRFYGAMIDSEALSKGRTYKEMPEVHIIYISEKDLWHEGKTCYPVDKYFRNTQIPYEDGMHVLYVNAEVDDGTDTAKLMQFFKTADPSDTSQGALSQRIIQLKEGEMKDMYDVANEFIEAGRKDGLEKGRADALQIVRLYLAGSSVEKIAEKFGEDESAIQEMLLEAGVMKE